MQAKLLLPYFERLADTSKRIDADSILNQFQQAEKEKIEATYQHFQEIKKILNKEQLSDFEFFIRRASDRMLSGKQKNHLPPKDFDD